jgi:MoxR-like ATPase
MPKPTIRYGKVTPTRLHYNAAAGVAFVLPHGTDDRIRVDSLNLSELVSIAIRHCHAVHSAFCELPLEVRILRIQEFAERANDGRDWTSAVFVPKGERPTPVPAAPVPADPADDSIPVPDPTPLPVQAPREPVPAAPVAPVAPVPAAGSLDAVIANVATAAADAAIRSALESFDPVDMDAITATIDAATAASAAAVAAAVDSIPAAVDAAVDKLRPTIIRIADREPVTIQDRTHAVFPKVLAAMTAGDPVNPFLTGPAGTGKTYLARQLATALDVPYVVLSCHPMMSKAEMIGYMSPGTNEHVAGPIAESLMMSDGAVTVFDEMDASNPAALVMINDMAAASPGTRFRLADGSYAVKTARHYFIGTANTFGTGPSAEYVGRNALDAATLDRFAAFTVDYDRDVERDLIAPHLNGSSAAFMTAVERMRTNAASNKIRTVISTRGVRDAASLIAAGFEPAEAVQVRIVKGLGADQTAKLLDGVSFAGITARAAAVQS